MKLKKKFFFRSDVSYTMPGAKDEIVVSDSFGKKRLRKYYLTMYLRNAYAFLYETKQVEMDCGHKMSCLLVTPLVINVNL